MEMIAERGIQVDPSTLYRWVQAYGPEMSKRVRRHLKSTSSRWHVDETVIKVKGRWVYLYRATDDEGQTVDFLLSAKRDILPASPWTAGVLQAPLTEKEV